MISINHLLQVPPSIEFHNKPIYFSVLLAAISGLIVNILLGVLFYSESLWLMVALCFTGFAFWGSAIIYLRKGRIPIAVNIGMFELCFHIGAIVSYLGTDYGAQYLLWPAIAFVSLNTRENTRLTKAISLVCIAELVLLYTFVPSETANKHFSDRVIWIHIGLTLIAAVPNMFVLLSMKSMQIRQKRKLQHVANHDHLTDLFNRGFFTTLLEYDEKALHTGGGPFLLAIADVDHFKQVNDTYGHDVGDEVLKDLAALFKTHLRDSDAVCRWGGEEFAFIFRRCDLDNADIVLEKLLNAVREKRFSGKKLPVTISMGAAQAVTGESADELMKRCDVLLYKAKSNGRNCYKYLP
jgi:diguanylate cyclase (GGDEF)-like protein